jgi:tetratricopeptide (TPR) repeat protein
MAGRGGRRAVLGIGLLGLLPGLGGDSPHDAVRQGNALYRTGQYEAAAQAYDRAATALPEAAEIRFNQGDAAFKQFRYDQAVEYYLAALVTENAQLASQAQYNLANVRHRQALQAMQTFQDALSPVQAAIAFYRDSLELDPARLEARYNLELAYRLLDAIEAQQVQGQRNAETRNQETSDNQGQPFAEQADEDEETRPDEARPDEQQPRQGRQARQAPPNNAATSSGNQLRQASAPQDITPEEAEALLEVFRERSQAAQSLRLDARRSRLRDDGFEKYW